MITKTTIILPLLLSIGVVPLVAIEADAALWSPCTWWTCPETVDVSREINYYEMLDSSPESEYSTDSYCGDDVDLDSWMYYSSGTITIAWGADSTSHQNSCQSSTLDWDHLGIQISIPGEDDIEWETNSQSGFKSWYNTGIDEDDYIHVSAHFVYE
jgi:hypothetical protein